MADLEIGLDQQPIPTSDVSVDFTSATFTAAPKAALIIGGDGATNGTNNADWRQSIGAVEGTRQALFFLEAQNGETTTDIDSWNRTDMCHLRLGSRGAESDQLALNSYLTNGVRLDTTEASPFEKLVLAIMFGGSQVTAELGNVRLSTQDTEVTETFANDMTGETPDIIFFWGLSQQIDVGGDHGRMSMGVAWNNGGTIVQRGVIMRVQEDSVSATNTHSVLRNDRVGGESSVTADTTAVSYELTDISAGSFGITSRGGGSTNDLHYLALKLGPGLAAWLGDVDLPTSTGNASVTSTGVAPAFVYQVNTMHTDVNTDEGGAKSSVLGVSAMVSGEQYSYCWNNEAGASPSDNNSLADNVAVHILDDDGTDAYVGTLTSLDSEGWTVNYTTVDATARKTFALVIGDAVSTGVDGSGTVQASTATVDGSGQVTPLHTGSGTPSAQQVTVTGVAERTVTGAGTPSAQQATLNGTAVRAIAAAGTPAAQRATMSGAGAKVFTANGALAAQQASIAGTVVPTTTATGAMAAQQAEISASATLTRNIAAALQAANATLTATGDAYSTLTGSGVLVAQQATLSADAAAFQGLTASGVLQAQQATLSGAGTRVSTGDGVLTAQEAALVAGVAVTSTLTGTGTLAAGSASLEATGLAYSTASGALQAGSAALDGEGAIIRALRTADGELQAQSAEIAAQILRTVVGSGTMSANAATADIYPWIELHAHGGTWEEQSVDSVGWEEQSVDLVDWDEYL